jgi:hypothetical protein
MVAHPDAPRATAPVKPAKADKKKKGKKEAAVLPRENYITITFRPHDSMFPVFGYTAGVILKDGSESTVTIGKDKFSLFASGDTAWARTTAIDQAIAKTLRKAPTLEASAKTVKGALLRDKFSLKGADQAYKKIATSCGIP